MDERPCQPFDDVLIRRVADGRRHGTHAGNAGVDIAEYRRRDGAERPAERVLGVDDVGAAERGPPTLPRRSRRSPAAASRTGYYDRLMSDQATLAGRGVLVTGASSGIGRAIALASARAGADVAITYRTNADGAGEVAQRDSSARTAGGGAPTRSGRRRVDPAVGPAARAALGRLDVWVNNAGADILTGTAALSVRRRKLDLLLAVDLRGTMLASWEAVALLGATADGGVIINMSWDHVLSGMAGRNPQMFAAVKGGVLAFSKSLARSVAPRVRVNVLAPGWIETSFGTGLDEALARAIADVDATRALGHARGRRRRGRVSRVARGSVPDGADDAGWWRGSHVTTRSQTIRGTRS